MNRVKVLQLNIRGLRKNREYLEMKLEQIKPDVVCLNETKTKQPPSIKGYNTAAYIKSSVWGTAIYIQQELSYKVQELVQRIDADLHKTQEMIRVTTQAVDITCIYCSPRHKLDTDLLKSSNTKHLLVGDFNIENPSINTNSILYNDVGKKLEELLREGNYILLNEDTPTHARGGLLDLHIASKTLTEDHSQTIIDKDTPSDHFLTISTFCNNKKEMKYYRRCDWKVFKEKLQKREAIELSGTKENLEEQAELFSNDIFECYQSSIKICTYKYTNMRLHNLVRLKRKLEREIAKLKSNNLSFTQVYAQSRKKLNDTKREIKNEYRRLEESKELENLNELNKSDRGEKFWKAAKSLLSSRSSKTDPFLLGNQEAANLFATKLSTKMTIHKSVSSEALKHQKIVTATIKKAKTDNFNLDGNNTVTLNITRQELKDLISTKKNTAPGEDHISYKILKNLPECTLDNFVRLLNLSFQIGYVPLVWKTAAVTMIPKPDKELSDPKNYRPISLTSCIGKIAETFVSNCLMSHCEEKDILGELQTAYRKNRSATDNLLYFTQRATYNLNWKGATATCLLDVESAFDSVWHDGILYRLIENETPSWIVKWTDSFLTDRKVKVLYKNAISEEFSPKAGVPQGGVLSPLLFIIYVQRPNAYPSTALQFADDLEVSNASRRPKMCTRSLQKSLDNLSDWCDKWKIMLNPSKTVFMMISRQRLKKEPTISLKNQRIKRSKQAEFLGLNISDDMRWKKHVDSLIPRLEKRVGMLSYLKAKQVCSTTLKYLYKSYIRPIFLYGIPAWANLSTKCIKRIQRVQNRAIRICYNLPIWTSTAELHKVSNLDTVDKCMAKLSIRYLDNNKHKPKIQEVMQLALPNDESSQKRTPITAINLMRANEPN